MKLRYLPGVRYLALCLSIFTLATLASAQDENPASDVRVSVVLNADGSRTVFQADPVNRKSTATTTGKDGKVRETIKYDLDENGRFTHGVVSGANGQFKFTANYKYDANGRLVEETHSDKGGTVIGKLVFKYDGAGHQIGYAAYDGAGHLLGQTSAPTPPAAKRK